MKITLSPIRIDTPLTALRKGDVLILNDISYDLAKGDDCPWLVDPAMQIKGVWQVTLLLPHAADAPEETLFPKAITLTRDGPVPLPPHAFGVKDDPPPPEPI